MNNPSPLMPQGSLLEQKNKGRAKVKIAVFFVLAIHAVGLMALLMQGCRKESTTANTAATKPHNVVAPTFEPTSQPPLIPARFAAVTPSNPPPVVDIQLRLRRHRIHHRSRRQLQQDRPTVSRNRQRSLMAANPGVDPTKLQLGKKIKIPPPAPVAIPRSQIQRLLTARQLTL